MKLQKARKQHDCDLCSKKIPVGHKYWREYNHGFDVINRREHTNCELYAKNKD